MTNQQKLLILIIALISALAINYFIGGKSTFTHPLNYYTFKVPKDVRIVNKNTNPVELVKSNQTDDQISVVKIFIFEVGKYPNTLPNNLEEWIRQDLVDNNDLMLDQTTLDNQPAFIAKYSGGGMTGSTQYKSIYAIHPQGSTIVSISFSNNGDDGDVYSSYQEILETFQFI